MKLFKKESKERTASPSQAPQRKLPLRIVKLEERIAPKQGSHTYSYGTVGSKFCHHYK